MAWVAPVTCEASDENLQSCRVQWTLPLSPKPLWPPWRGRPRRKKTNTRLSPRCEHQRWLGLALPTRSPTQLHMRSSGRRCAGRQLYVFSSCSGLRRRRSLLSRAAPTPAGQHNVERQLSRSNAESLFMGVGVTFGGQLHSLTRPGSLPTKAPHSY